MKIVRVGQGVMLVFAAILAAYGAARAQALNDIQDATQPKQKSVTFVNDTSAAAGVWMNIGAESSLTISDLGSFCDSQSVPSLNQCHFTVPANGSVPLPNPSFKYFQGSVSFNHKVSCGATHAEVSANNPDWYDIEDVSVVDGFNNKIELDATSTEDGTQKLGPPAGKTGNQLLFGVFPFACTTCDAINNPPCGSLGPKECHPVGPSPPCQYQMNPANGSIEVILQP